MLSTPASTRCEAGFRTCVVALGARGVHLHPSARAESLRIRSACGNLCGPGVMRLYRTSAVEASRYVVLHAEDGRVSRASLRTGTGVVKSQEYGLVCTPGLERRSRRRSIFNFRKFLYALCLFLVGDKAVNTHNHKATPLGAPFKASLHFSDRECV